MSGLESAGNFPKVGLFCHPNDEQATRPGD